MIYLADSSHFIFTSGVNEHLFIECADRNIIFLAEFMSKMFYDKT